MHIEANNTNDMADKVYPIMFSQGIEHASRNGQVLTIEEPVTLTYFRPMERVNFMKVREANPFFHLLEAIWMMAGRHDVKWIADILPEMEKFSDDGSIFYGAYGPRIFAHNQLMKCAGMLNSDRDTRRAVATIWRVQDIEEARNTKDLPCNLMLMFRVIGDSMNMTVVNRSNDAVWGGVTGSNIVHFSIMQEYVAKMAGFRVGKMHVFTNNLHMYLNEQAEDLADYYARTKWRPPEINKYSQGTKVTSISTRDQMEMFPTYCNDWIGNCDNAAYESESSFIREVVSPMYIAYKKWRAGVIEKNDGWKSLAYDTLVEMPEKCDWRIAAMAWMERRIDK